MHWDKEDDFKNEFYEELESRNLKLRFKTRKFCSLA